jgi:Nif11 domain
MSKDGLEALCARVSDDPELASQLRGTDPARFAGEAVRLAGRLGFEVSESEIEQAVAQGRLSWTTRWLR